MTTAPWIVNLIGATSIGLIAWYFWLNKKEGVAAAVVAGIQEVNVTVKGGYQPSTIVVKAGAPVRLHFTRMESSLCTEMVIFDGVDRSAKLPEGETVTVDFARLEPGEIPFQCQMGMIRGRILVTE